MSRSPARSRRSPSPGRTRFVILACPGCSARLRIPQRKELRKVRCAHCGHILTAPPADTEPPTPSTIVAVPPEELLPSPESVLTLNLDALRLPGGLIQHARFELPEAETQRDDPWVGRTLGSYRIQRILGVGGWGSVYLAEHLLLGHPVALKILDGEMATDMELVERFLGEGRICARLRHPLIRGVLDAGESAGAYYLTLEYVDGVGLHSFVDDNGPLDHLVSLRIVHQVVLALRFALLQGVIHRDVKPSNILVGRDGLCRLTDFGLAKAFLLDRAATATGVVLGTPQFMSPEQFEGARIDHRSDIYSLGCTLYYMICGAPPFDASDLITLMQMHKLDPPPSPLEYSPNLPREVVGLLSKMLAKDPKARFQDYESLLETMAAIVASRAGEAFLPVALSDTSRQLASRWLDEARQERCAEIREKFLAAEIDPPPTATLMARLGYAQSAFAEPDWETILARTLQCPSCRLKRSLGELHAPGDLLCPECQEVLQPSSGFAVSQEACYVRLAVQESLELSRRTYWEDVYPLVVFLMDRLGHNVVLEFEGVRQLPQEALSVLFNVQSVTMETRQFLVLNPDHSDLMKQLASLGFKEFIGTAFGRESFEHRFESARLCPHLREFYTYTEGGSQESIELCAEGLAKACGSCVDREHFERFYGAALEFLQRPRVALAGQALEALDRAQQASCSTAAAEKLRRVFGRGVKRVLRERGLYHLKRGSPGGVNQHARFLQELFPDDPEGYALQAKARQLAGDSGEALRLMEQARKRAPDPATYDYELALLMWAQKDYERTIEFARKACENPAYREKAMPVLAEALFRLKRIEEVLEVSRGATERLSATMHLLRGRAYHRLGRLEEALHADSGQNSFGGFLQYAKSEPRA